jgi:hypothetical protein
MHNISLKKIALIIAGCAMASPLWAMQFVVKNALPTNSPCTYGGNSLSIFTGGQSQPTVIPTVHAMQKSVPFTGNFSSNSLGIQVNNWYWVAKSTPVQSSPVQNPDNSGAQFLISSSCTIISQSPPVYGQGIPTYYISNVTAAMKTGVCEITVSKNPYTNAVTPGCCSPPGIGEGTCPQGTWGQTNNGKQWPPM